MSRERWHWRSLRRVGAVAALIAVAVTVSLTGFGWWASAAWAGTQAGAQAAALVSHSPQAIYQAPVTGGSIVRLFERPPQRWNPGHRGLDFSAHEGQEVRAPGAGVVTHAGTVVDRGTVTVMHSNGLRSSLEPVDVLVEVGERVAAGSVVGTVQEGHRHCAPQVCVHWGVREGSEYLNPLDWLVGYGPVRLLPLAGAA